MPTTPAWSLPYPTGTQVPDVPSDMLALATAVDTQLTNITNRIGGEWRANGNQSIAASSGANLLVLGGTIQAANGITWNGSNQATIVTAGLYAITLTAATGYAGTNNWSCAVGGAAGPAAGTAWVIAPTFSGGQTDSGVGGTRYLAAGTIVRPYLYNNGPTVLSLNPTTGKPTEFAVWRVG